MTIAYFDCFSGISGDMTLGALVDAGVKIETLRSELLKLQLAGYELKSEKVKRAGIVATKVHVMISHEKHEARNLANILDIIDRSSLSATIKQRSARIFKKLAEAEAKVHGTSIEHVHFHEIGAIDSIVDVVGSVICLELLGISSIVSSAVNVGAGSIETSHGLLPVPAPATAEILRGIPFYQSAARYELATPTGAAIIGTLGASFGSLPPMKIDCIGYGAGDRNLSNSPNVLRVMIGELLLPYDEDMSTIIETNIDDMSPQGYDYIIEKLLHEGAQDVYLTPIIMKKGRPAILLSVLTDRTKVAVMLDTIFRETTSIGVRIQDVGRQKLTRDIKCIDTDYGKVRIKISKRGSEIFTVTPEYDDCRKIAEEKHLPLKNILENVKKAYEPD